MIVIFSPKISSKRLLHEDYPFVYYWVRNDGKNNLVCGEIWDGDLVYTSFAYIYRYTLLFCFCFVLGGIFVVFFNHTLETIIETS